MVLRYLSSKSTFLLTSFRSTTRNASSFSELLKNRAVLKIRRDSCREFLQGLITNDVNLLSTQQCIYTALLNPKGRVLFDALIYRTDSPEEVLLECGEDISDAVMKHLRVHSLRKKIDVSKTDLSVWAVRKECSNGCTCVPDPRRDDPWIFRCIADSQPTSETEEGTYDKLRYTLGIAEGPQEIPFGEAFPLEYNIDFLNGVSFDKGCYVGQELTARVHHTGVVRKRIMPLELCDDSGENGDPTEPIIDSESGKAVGKIRGVRSNRALALMRVKETVSSKGLIWSKKKVKALIPSWWPPLTQDVIQKRQ